MKYAILIPDGAADAPVESLGGQTPIEAARTPHMDSVAARGLVGTAATTPADFEPGSDVCTMSLLGYDPHQYHTGRAPLEAAAKDIPLFPDDWVFRCNLVTVRDGVMVDHSAGGISDAEAAELLDALRPDVKKLPGFALHQGVSYRHLLTYDGGWPFDLRTVPPHEIPGERAELHLPYGAGDEVMRQLIDASRTVFADHPVNLKRRAEGRNEATQVWLWGQGHPPAMPKFAEKYPRSGVRSAAMITGVDLLRGLARLLGWENLSVPGMTSFHDTDYAAQGRATADALAEYDLVVSHVESPDEASHQADVATKVAAIEAIDAHVVGATLAALEKLGGGRVLILPDHPTNLATRKHGRAPVPFAMAGTGVTPDAATAYGESAAAGGLAVDPGHELMARFLG